MKWHHGPHHVACSGRWNVNKCDTSRRLEFSLAPPPLLWEEMPGPACWQARDTAAEVPVVPVILVKSVLHKWVASWLTDKRMSQEPKDRPLIKSRPNHQAINLWANGLFYAIHLESMYAHYYVPLVATDNTKRIFTSRHFFIKNTLFLIIQFCAPSLQYLAYSVFFSYYSPSFQNALCPLPPLLILHILNSLA